MTIDEHQFSENIEGRSCFDTAVSGFFWDLLVGIIAPGYKSGINGLPFSAASGKAWPIMRAFSMSSRDKAVEIRLLRYHDKSF